MRIFRNAIVRRPCRAMTEGITSGLYDRGDHIRIIPRTS